MLVFDNENARKDLQKFQLTKQYKKACDYIRDEQYYKVQLKLRKPKSKGISTPTQISHTCSLFL